MAAQIGLDVATWLLARQPVAIRRRVAPWVMRPFRKSQGWATLYGRVLRMPAREAARLDRMAASHDLETETDWRALLTRSRAGILADASHVVVDRPEIFRLAAEGGRPVILSPMHMGSYVLSLAAIVFRFFPGRSLLILRQRDDMPLETAVLERVREFGFDMRFLQIASRRDFLGAVKFARQGTVVVNFCDLPPAYGTPASMPMFGLPLAFAFGTEALARITGATVIPLATVATRRGDRVITGEPFEILGRDGTERREAADRTRRLIQRALCSHPEQWHLWHKLDEYMDGARERDRPDNSERTA